MSSYPLESAAIWRIAVSRRFSDPELSRYYHQFILPILSEEGLVMDASSASDIPGDVNFWLRRMRFIMDISDIHVFVDNRLSPSMWLEERYSDQLRRQRVPVTLITYLNWPFSLKLFPPPSKLSIRRLMTIVPLASPLGYRNISYFGSVSFQKRLRRSIRSAKWRRTISLNLYYSMLRLCDFLLKRFAAKHGGLSPCSIHIGRYLMMETEIATRLLDGEPIERLLSDEHLRDDINPDGSPIERFHTDLNQMMRPLRLYADKSQLEFARILTNKDNFRLSFRWQYTLFLKKIYKAVVFAEKFGDVGFLSKKRTRRESWLHFFLRIILTGC